MNIPKFNIDLTWAVVQKDGLKKILPIFLHRINDSGLLDLLICVSLYNVKVQCTYFATMDIVLSVQQSIYYGTSTVFNTYHFFSPPRISKATFRSSANFRNTSSVNGSIAIFLTSLSSRSPCIVLTNCSTVTLPLPLASLLILVNVSKARVSRRVLDASSPLIFPRRSGITMPCAG